LRRISTTYREKGQCLQQMVWVTLGIDMQKNEIGTLSYTIHKKINSKQIKDLNTGPETEELWGKKHTEKTSCL
jgi:hypothetical protein